jgi:hypothetical protein
VLIERQARITRLVLGIVVVAVIGGGGYAVSRLGERRELSGAARGGPAPESRPIACETRPECDSAPTASRAAPPPDVHADQTIAAIVGDRSRFTPDTVQLAWDAAKALRAEAASWDSQGVPRSEVNRLLAAALDTEKWILGVRPSFQELRDFRGEVRWPEVLGGFDDFGLRFLTKAEAARFERLSREFDKVADHNQGWIVRAEYEANAAPLVTKAREAHRAFDAMLETPIGRAARAVEIRDLAALRTDLPTVRFRPFYFLPYVLLVEQDDRWEEQDPAARIARTLLGLRESFFEAYAAKAGLARQHQRPVPVVLFTDRDAYHRYRAARKSPDVLGTEAHFEPAMERLVLHADCALATLLHEGMHQLIRANIRAPLATYAQSLWFHEGFAEWFAGSREAGPAADGLPRFEPGFLLESDVEPGRFLGPIAILRGTPRGARIPLRQLLEMMLKDRDRLEEEGASGIAKIHLVYAQGWFLIYFLNHFAVDAHGVVQVGARGAYEDVWLAYLRRELAGASGAPTFLETLREAGLPLERLEREMNAYADFVAAKVAKGHVRDRQLVPWSEAPKTDGKPAATASDDRLPVK